MAHDNSSDHLRTGKLKIKGIAEQPSKRRRRRAKRRRSEEIAEEGEEKRGENDTFADGYPGSDFDESALGPDERRNRDRIRNDQHQEDRHRPYEDRRGGRSSSVHASSYFRSHRRTSPPPPPPFSAEEGVPPPRWKYEGLGSEASSSVLNIANHHLRNEAGGLLNCVVFNETMDDEDYAEHIRLGMWRRTHREEMEQREKEKRLEEERLRREKEFYKEQRKREKIKKRAREEADLARKRMKSAQTREAYETAWKRIINRVRSRGTQGEDPQLSTERTIKPSEIPWPVRPEVTDEGEPVPITKAEISSFLISPNDDVKIQKQILRTAVLAYHPDRFDRVLELITGSDAEKEQLREQSLRVSQLLNELLSEFNSSRSN